MNASNHPYAGHRYPTEIISHAVWLYFRFTLSFRNVEELLAARSIVVTYETVRQRERQMRRFKSAGQAQHFLSAHGPINNLFCLGCHQTKAAHYRLFRDRAFALWRELTCVQNVA